MSVRELAASIDVATQAVYNWESGKNGVDDERAEQIATLLGTDLIDTRRNLGLWVPALPALDGPSESFDEIAERLERKYNEVLIPGFERILADPEKRKRLVRILSDPTKEQRLEFALRLIDDEPGETGGERKSG